VIDCYRQADETAPITRRGSTRRTGKVPVAWPHDGMNREKSGGGRSPTYREHGVNMLPKSARYPKRAGRDNEKGGPQPVEPIVDEMLSGCDRALQGVRATARLFEEKRSYHRKDGRIVDRATTS
jgi:hypothetical protein